MSIFLSFVTYQKYEIKIQFEKINQKINVVELDGFEKRWKETKDEFWCLQVSTTPHMSHYIHLNVIGKEKYNSLLLCALLYGTYIYYYYYDFYEVILLSQCIFFSTMNSTHDLTRV